MASRSRKVYLLHFDPAYEHAQHYLGSANDVQDRLKQHLSGQGSPLVAAAVQAGAQVSIVRVWNGGYDLEKQLKRRHNNRDFCPICNPEEKRNDH